MKLRNKSGITLIALIVTIIVLIIIAGISIATLTADNGILRQTNAAKVTQIEGNAREQVKLACSAMRLAVAEAQAKDNSYSAKANASLIQAKLIEVLNADKKDLIGSFSNGGTAAGDDQETEKFKIVYEGQDYKDAKNDQLAKITYTIGITQKSIELLEEKNDNTFTVSLATNIEGAGTVEFTGEHSGTKVDLRGEKTLTFKATTNSGYTFLGWYKNNTLLSTYAEYSFSFNDNATIEARFEEALVKFTVTESNRSKIGYTGAENENLVIPYKFQDTNGTWYKVTAINNSAFKNCTSLTSIEIPNSVTKIDYSAFNNCTSLTSVTIPDSVTSIGSSAFYNCTSLTSVEIPDGVKAIEAGTFKNCINLQNVSIPNSVTVIGGGYQTGAFQGCTSLTNITIPDSVTKIGYCAFAECTNLTGTIYDNVVYLGNENNPYLVLYKVADTSIASHEINVNTKIIHSYAFKNCTGLTSIKIHNSITSFGEYAFSGCSNLKTVYYEGSIDQWIQSNITSTSTPCFNGAKLYIANELLTSLVIPSTWKISSKFSGCTSITNITILNGVTSISDSAFQKCTGLTNITIPDSVTSIAGDAFRSCTGLTSVTIPNSVTKIGNYAFYECSRLQTITIEAITPPTFGTNMFNYCSKLTSIYVPAESVDAYKTTSGWSDLAAKILPIPTTE